MQSLEREGVSNAEHPSHCVNQERSLAVVVGQMCDAVFSCEGARPRDPEPSKTGRDAVPQVG